MGRPVKKGLEFVPIDVDLFDDYKIIRLMIEHGHGASTFYIFLILLVYKEGYYLKTTKEDVIKRIQMMFRGCKSPDPEYISKILDTMLELGLFDKVLFEKKSVLTSHGIQKRFNYIELLSKRKYLVSEYCLLSEEEINNCGGTLIKNNSGETTVIYGKSNINSAKSTQIKRNKSKVNKTKLNKSKLNKTKLNKKEIKDSALPVLDGEVSDDDLPF